MSKKYRASVHSETSKGQISWWYSCDCPKIGGGSVGPFDLRKLAEDVANLHNRAEPNH